MPHHSLSACEAAQELSQRTLRAEDLVRDCLARIDARDSDGKLVSVGTQMTGEVTGVDFSGTEPVLIVGGARVNLSAMISVRQKTAADTAAAEDNAV